LSFFRRSRPPGAGSERAFEKAARARKEFGLTSVPLLQGWSGRVTGGVAMAFGRGALSAGGEYGGIGSDFHIWIWRMRGTVAF
jgi:hypothetical protein